MIIVDVDYKVDLAEVDKYTNAHREFLEPYYAKGVLLASGPKQPRTGGVIIALTGDLTALKAILANDPFQLAGIAEYHYTVFTPVKHRQEINALVRK